MYNVFTYIIIIVIIIITCIIIYTVTVRRKMPPVAGIEPALVRVATNALVHPATPSPTLYYIVIQKIRVRVNWPTMSLF